MKYLLFCLMFFNTNLFGQIKLKDLQGYWVCPNQDSSYFKKDTLVLIQFHSSMNDTLNKYRYEYCEFYDWEIKKTDVRIHELQICKEPTTEKAWTPSRSYTLNILKKNNATLVILNNFNTKNSSEIFELLKFQRKTLD